MIVFNKSNGRKALKLWYHFCKSLKPCILAFVFIMEFNKLNKVNVEDNGWICI